MTIGMAPGSLRIALNHKNNMGLLFPYDYVQGEAAEIPGPISRGNYIHPNRLERFMHNSQQKFKCFDYPGFDPGGGKNSRWPCFCQTSTDKTVAHYTTHLMKKYFYFFLSKPQAEHLQLICLRFYPPSHVFSLNNGRRKPTSTRFMHHGYGRLATYMFCGDCEAAFLMIEATVAAVRVTMNNDTNNPIATQNANLVSVSWVVTVDRVLQIGATDRKSDFKLETQSENPFTRRTYRLRRLCGIICSSWRRWSIPNPARKITKALDDKRLELSILQREPEGIVWLGVDFSKPVTAGV
ncbi:hypothetical protein BU17DRAFT_63055 [Hysterangium stoloniferum]|nr:hypothetical protein BU17DRAFT_63055 [Hysterangium stoloniferum]